MYNFENYFYPFIIARITWFFVGTLFIKGNFGCISFFSILSKTDYFRSKFVKSPIFRLIIPKNSQIWSVLFSFNSVLAIFWHICCNNTFAVIYAHFKIKTRVIDQERAFLSKIIGRLKCIPQMLDNGQNLWFFKKFPFYAIRPFDIIKIDKIRWILCFEIYFWDFPTLFGKFYCQNRQKTRLWRF